MKARFELGVWGFCAMATVASGWGCAAQAKVGDATYAPPQAGGMAVPRNDGSRCEWRGRADREVSESAGPGATVPNVRRVYQLVGSGEDKQKVLICREIDTDLDGIKDVVRVYNDKGESLYEQADSDYDGMIDTWLTFAGGRVVEEARDTSRRGKPDVWKHYVNGQLSRVQRDTNGDGKPDRWELYSEGRLERIGVDLDYDGFVDRWDRDESKRAAEEAAQAKGETNAAEK